MEGDRKRDSQEAVTTHPIIEANNLFCDMGDINAAEHLKDRTLDSKQFSWNIDED